MMQFSSKFINEKQTIFLKGIVHCNSYDKFRYQYDSLCDSSWLSQSRGYKNKAQIIYRKKVSNNVSKKM